MPDATDTTTPAKVDPTKGHSCGPFFVIKETVITTDRDENGNPDCPVDSRAWIGEFYGSETERAAADAAFAALAMNSHDALVEALDAARALTALLRYRPEIVSPEGFDRAVAMMNAAAKLARGEA